MYFIVNAWGKHVLKHYHEFVYLILGVQQSRYIHRRKNILTRLKRFLFLFFLAQLCVSVPHLWYQTSCFLKILPHFDCVHTIYTNYSALAHNFNNTVRVWSWKSSFCCWTEQGSRISILAGLRALGAAFAHQLHAATADGEGHCDLEKEVII